MAQGGLDPKTSLAFASRANVESLSLPLFSKSELKEFARLQAGCDRLIIALNAASAMSATPQKIVATWVSANPGEPVPESVLTEATSSESRRQIAKKGGKFACREFFETACLPAALDVFGRVAELLAGTISERVRAEQKAFETMREFYGDDIGFCYRPSQGLLALIARRIQLLNMEIVPQSPPSLKGALAGILCL